MLKFEVNKKYPSFKFSSKNEVVILPPTYNELRDDEKELIKEILTKSRELYIFKLKQNRESPCIGILQARAEAVQEVLQDYTQEQIENVWFKFHPRKNKINLNKPITKISTSLDQIEENPYISLDS